MDIEIEEVKKLNYKKIILVVAIVVAIIACVYIGIILPQIVKKNNEKQNINMYEQLNGENTANTNVQEEVKAEEPEKKPYPVMNATSMEKLKNIYNSDYKRVFLTFDDGPSKTVTPEILSILDNYGIKASFFVLGSRAELYPDLIKDEFNRGHYIANHGYSHQYSYLYSATDNVIGEYRKTEGIVRDILGVPEYLSNIFRFPGGLPGGKYANQKKEAAQVLENNNIGHIDWNCLTRDAEGKFTKEQLLDNLINTSQEKDSIVVLMHDAGDKQTTVEALPSVIEYYKNNGYVFENFYDILGETN